MGKGRGNSKSEKNINDFSHFDSQGNAVMVNVSDKENSLRHALARGSITMSKKAFEAVNNKSISKGDVLSVARIAGIMAAKRCSELIPLCHPLIFDECVIDFAMNEENHEIENYEIEATCQIKLHGKTGAEMEALTGVSVTLLTIYDMCKALDKTMVIGNIYLLEKSGGKSGKYFRQ